MTATAWSMCLICLVWRSLVETVYNSGGLSAVISQQYIILNN